MEMKENIQEIKIDDNTTLIITGENKFSKKIGQDIQTINDDVDLKELCNIKINTMFTRMEENLKNLEKIKNQISNGEILDISSDWKNTFTFGFAGKSKNDKQIEKIVDIVSLQNAVLVEHSNMFREILDFAKLQRALADHVEEYLDDFINNGLRDKDGKISDVNVMTKDMAKYIMQKLKHYAIAETERNMKLQKVRNDFDEKFAHYAMRLRKKDDLDVEQTKNIEENKQNIEANKTRLDKHAQKFDAKDALDEEQSKSIEANKTRLDEHAQKLASKDELDSMQSQNIEQNRQNIEAHAEQLQVHQSKISKLDEMQSKYIAENRKHIDTHRQYIVAGHQKLQEHANKFAQKDALDDAQSKAIEQIKSNIAQMGSDIAQVASNIDKTAEQISSKFAAKIATQKDEIKLLQNRIKELEEKKPSNLPLILAVAALIVALAGVALGLK